MQKSVLSIAWFVLCTWLPLTHAGDVDDYQNQWIHRALTLQRQLDWQIPLAQSTFVATHNSYNSSSYSTAGSYWDPNQSRSLTDQLRMDVRALELDVHSFFNTSGWPWQWRKNLLLCHGQNNHLGCSSFDRKFEDGLREIKSWMDRSENQQELVLLYIENHIDSDQYNEAINQLNAVFGNLIYRPPGGHCQGIPMQVTREQLVQQWGKRVLLMTDGCPNGAFSSWVFGGVGDHLHGFRTGSISELGGFPYCNSNRFSRSDYDRYLIRFYEDRTNLSAMFGDPGEPLTPDVMRTINRCGANILGMDKLTPFDGRLEAAVWSWGANEPNNWNGMEHCAEHTAANRFNDLFCEFSLPVACKNSVTQQWSVTRRAVRWQDAAQACRDELGAEAQLATPRNGYDNEQLIMAKAAAGAARVWLSYNDRSQEGRWLP